METTATRSVVPVPRRVDRVESLAIARSEQGLIHRLGTALDIVIVGVDVFDIVDPHFLPDPTVITERETAGALDAHERLLQVKVDH